LSAASAVSLAGRGPLSLTSASPADPGPSSNSGRREREKKLVAYRTYDPKEALGLAGPEHKDRWLLLRVRVA
jgi:hypothetical protein